MKLLTIEQERSIKGNEAIALATVTAILTIAILSIVVWKLVTSDKGGVTIPGGFKFEWSVIKNAFLSTFR